MIRTTTLLLALAAALHAQSGATFSADYFPLEAGLSYQYESSIGDMEGETRAKGVGTILTYEGDGIVYRQTYLANDEGVFLNRLNYTVDLLVYSSESVVTYDKPVLIYPFPLEVGERWTWTGKEFYGEDNRGMTLRGHARKTQRIETPAGAYDCLVVDITMEYEGKEEPQRMTQYLAEGVGVVRLEAPLGGSAVAWIAKNILGMERFAFSLTAFSK
ncbi:MAG: hypothetical protein GF419_06240 [Ignavibacteriales bacterium]|nr:hypothetical protein [Ignavibacteriales bacterium]